jgi:hypothetical protein
MEKTVRVIVTKRGNAPGSFSVTSEHVPASEFNGAYFCFNQKDEPTLVLKDSRIVVIRSMACGGVAYYDEDEREEP